MVEERKRGVWLTIWLILMLIANFFVAITYLLLNKTIASIYPNVAQWIWYLYGLIGLANIVFVIFLFMWKKWPFFAFCGTAIIAFIMNLITGFGIIASSLGLVVPIILYLFMRSRWNLFGTRPVEQIQIVQQSMQQAPVQPVPEEQQTEPMEPTG